MLFGFYVIRPPLEWSTLPDAMKDWFQSAGGVSAFALLMVTLAAVVRSEQSAQKRREAGPMVLLFSLLFPPVALLLWWLVTIKRRWLAHEKAMQLPLLILGSALTIGIYEVYIVQRFLGMLFGRQPGPWSEKLLTWGGVFAVFWAMLPMVTATLLSVHIRRIWALARLSFKEALRSKVVLVFALMALVFLFADFFVGFKEENQVRNYVKVTYWSMVPLFMLTATILGSFSIPNDIKNQSIHTIVTKPVEKLEIVLGRFLGFGMLLMLGLLAVAGVSYLYIWRGVTPEARIESFRARMPVYGNISFVRNNKPDTGEASPRSFDYRIYISGPQPRDPKSNKNYAVWEFDDLPVLPDDQDWVRFEYAFDIYRTHKGEQGQSITCTFSFIDGRLPAIQEAEKKSSLREGEKKSWVQEAEKHFQKRYQKFTELSTKKTKMTKQPLTDKEREDIDQELLKEFHCYQITGQDIINDHTQSIQVPGELFKQLRQPNPNARAVGAPGRKERPILKVLVNVEDTKTGRSQLVGVSKNDFYILPTENDFWQNYFKGILGMGMSILLVLGISVACSTYLSGVVSWLVTLFLLLAGGSRDFVKELAEGRAYGGGPIQAMQNLAENRPMTAGAVDPDSIPALVRRLDEFYQWLLRIVLNIFPDINRFDLIEYVANGFDIPWVTVLFLDNFVYLVGYLLPWLILSYYMLKFREIANPT